MDPNTSSLPPQHAPPSRHKGFRHRGFYSFGVICYSTFVLSIMWTIAIQLIQTPPFAVRDLVFNEPTGAATSLKNKSSDLIDATFLQNKSSDLIDHFVQPKLVQPKLVEPKGELPGNKVFMSGPHVPMQIIQHNSIQEPNLEFHVFNNSAMAWSVKLIDRELREKAGLEGAWEAWASLRPWAFRVDLWRYMILWSEGGVYMDTKMRITAPLSTWAALSDYEELSCCSDNNLKYRSTEFPENELVKVLWNGAMSARKGSHVMLEAIRATIDNIYNHRDGLPYLRGVVHNKVLSITGPVVLGYAARDFVRRGSVRIPCLYAEGKYGSLEQSAIHIFEKDVDEHTRVHESPGGNVYGNLYIQKLVYCDTKVDGPDTPCDLDALLNGTQIQ